MSISEIVRHNAERIQIANPDLSFERCFDIAFEEYQTGCQDLNDDEYEEE